MKRFPRLMLGVLLLSSLLVGCFGAEETMPPPNPVTIRFAFLGQQTDFEPLVGEFNVIYPDTTVELVPLSVQGYDFSRITEALDTVDAFRYSMMMADENFNERLYPLDELMMMDMNFNPDDFFPGSLEALKLEGKQLGLPAGLNPMVLYYENLRFKIAKIEPPDANYTLDDVLADAIAINNPDAEASSGYFAYGFCTHPDLTDALILTYVFGGGLTDSLTEPTRATLDRPENVAALKWYADLWLEYEVAPPVTENAYEIYQLVDAPSCGYWFQFLEFFHFFGSSSVTEARPLPLPDMGGQSLSLAFMDGYYLTGDAPNKLEAFRWINFLAHHQAASLDLVPPLKSLIASNEYAQRASPEVVAVARSLPDNTYFIGLDDQGDTAFGQVVELHTQAVNRVVSGEVDALTALQEAQDQAEDIQFVP